MNMILNLTMHNATPEQVLEGVQQNALPEIKTLLNFETLPTSQELVERAEAIVNIAQAQSGLCAMIGGAPFFMPYLERALLDACIQPLYAFSVRQSVELHNEDGSVTKQNIFKHVGWVGA